MTMAQNYDSIDGNKAWDIIERYIKEEKSFHSVTDISYQAEVHENLISYKGGSGNRGVIGESISKSDFIEAFNRVRVLPEINTSTIKNIIQSSLYQKRTPFIGLLYSAGILVK